MSSIKLSKIISSHKSKYQADIFRGLYLLFKKKSKYFVNYSLILKNLIKIYLFVAMVALTQDSNHIICDIVKLLYNEILKK